MNKQLIKLWFRNIIKNKIQLITITAIMFLSMSFLMGLLSTSDIIKDNVNNYLKTTKFYDMKLVSFGGFSNEDIKKIESLSNVDTIRRDREEDLWIEKDDGKKLETKIIYIDEFKKEDFYLIDGKLPTKRGEILLAVGNNIIDGDYLESTIKIYKDKNISNKEYKVTGIILSPYLISLRGEATNIGGGVLKNVVYAYEEDKLGFETLNIYLKKNKTSFFSTRYEDSLNDLDEELKTLDEARIKNISPSDIVKNPYYQLPWRRNKSLEVNGLDSFSADIEKVSAIAKIFPFFFFMVGFLVVITSLTKVIDEDRKDIGTLISLGYSKRTIYGFYLLYGLFISFIASLIAIPIGFELFPRVIAKAYSTGYNLPNIEIIYLKNILMPIILISTIVLLFTIFYVTRKILKEKPAELFLDKETRNIKNKKIVIERISFIWRLLSFRTRVNIRNIFLFKKRMLMTIVGIAGCFALILTSFGLKDSISSIVDKQYSKIYTYDLRLSVKSYEELADKSYVEKTLKIANEDATVSSDKRRNFEKASLSIIEDNERLKGFINLYDENNKKIDFSEKGIYLSQKLSEIYDLKIGDSIKLELRDRKYNFRVAGVFENYIGHQLIIRESYFTKITNIKPNYKSVYLNFDKEYSEEEIEVLIEELMEDENIFYAISTKLIKSKFRDSVNNLNYIIIVLNISAGLLTFVILYNLANINIIERRKELATLKVLGFLPKEIRKYIFRETNGLSFLGILFGFPLGIMLHKFVITKIEVGGMMLGREIQISSYLISILLIICFIKITNMFLKKKINKVDMVEAMKAND